MSAPKRLFLDACILVTAANSPEGGSARLLQLAAEGKVRLIATRRVLHEAKGNIITLLGRPLWAWFVRTIGPLRLSLADSPTRTEKSEWSKVTHEKDAHILAGAIKAKADILISLDRRHVLKPSVQEAFPIPIMSPGDFLQKFGLVEPLPPDHPSAKKTRAHQAPRKP
jgi:predicted nucleic acid-binding protein